MKRLRIPWYLWPWPHVRTLLAGREQARRIAEQLWTDRAIARGAVEIACRQRDELRAELDRTQAAASALLSEFGAMRIELDRWESRSRINRNNRLARSAAGRELVQSTAAAINTVVYPRRKQRG